MAARKNPSGGVKGDKLWRDALRVACLRPFPGGPKGQKYLTRIAEQVVTAAANGDIHAAKEIGDRLDGKPAQIIAGDAEGDPIRVDAELSDRDLARRIAMILGQAGKG